MSSKGIESESKDAASELARRRWVPWWRAGLAVAALTIAVVTAVAFLEGGRPITRPIINSARLVGTWTGPNGGTMTFRTDQTVTVHNLNLSDGMIRGCGDLSATGMWQFASLQGDTGSTPLTYSKSNIIAVDFLGPASSDGCSTEFTTWKDHPLTMCQELDPDSPCSNPVLTKQG